MIDCAVIQVISGAHPGKKLWLRQREFSRVGSSEYADQALDDPEMSGVHFLLSLDEVGFRVRDLNSRLGTFVNGERVDFERGLLHGDELRAGSLRFRVTLVEYNASVPVPAPTTITVAPSAREFQQSTLQSGLSRYEPINSQLSFSEATRRLFSARRGFVLIQLQAFSVHTVPSYFNQIINLADDVGLLPIDSEATRREVVTTLSGKAAMLYVASPLEADALVGQMAYMASIYRDFRMLRHQLETGKQVFVDGLMTNIDAILAEHDDGTRWQLYSAFEFDELMPANCLAET